MDNLPPAPLVILGSSRKNSDTLQFLQWVFENSPFLLADLLDYTIHPYSYANDYYPDDQFEDIIQQLLKHQIIVLATPVYWYAMSGLMKTFFDRLTDLVTVRKEWGRKLRGKRILLLAVGSEEALPSGFEIPFKRTADYLGMEYRGSIYYSTKSSTSQEEREKLRTEFIKSLY